MRSYAQEFDQKVETEKLLNSILKQDSVSKNLFDFANNIIDYEFEGNYSPDRIFPDRIKKDSTGQIIMISTICVVPLEFENPIWSVLKEIDSSYDSTYYQEQIRNADRTPWSKRNLNLEPKIKFVKWKWRKLHHETNLFSTPIFSKNKKLAIIKFGSINGKSMEEKPARILIFQKENDSWQLSRTINRVKNK
jgi:hypothetical protein